jgi:hypothetical protein
MNIPGINPMNKQAMPHKVLNNIAGASPTNVGKWERIGSALLGGFLVYRSIKRRKFGSLLLGGSAGLNLLKRGLSGYCPMYGKMKVSSAQG